MSLCLVLLLLQLGFCSPVSAIHVVEENSKVLHPVARTLDTMVAEIGQAHADRDSSGMYWHMEGQSSLPAALSQSRRKMMGDVRRGRFDERCSRSSSKTRDALFRTKKNKKAAVISFGSNTNLCQKTSNGNHIIMETSLRGERKPLWVYGKGESMLTATATRSAPIHMKAFEIIPVSYNCTDNDWVLLRSDDGSFLQVDTNTNDKVLLGVSWRIRATIIILNEAKEMQHFHFLLQKSGNIRSRYKNAVFYVIPKGEHASTPFDFNAYFTQQDLVPNFLFDDTMALIHLKFISLAGLMKSKQESIEEEETSKEIKQKCIQNFAKAWQPMLSTRKKMIISFSLYGNNDKYLQGAINNVILAKTVFSGWICRFYCALSVLLAIKEDLHNLGAEIENVPYGVGATGPMLWRFLPAADKKVAAFIVRDAD